MLNYNKTRESVEKNSSKKSLSKGLSANKSHTSSINIKLSQDLSYVENMKIPLKNLFKEKFQQYPTSSIQWSKNINLSKNGNSGQKPKYSIKLSSNENRQKQNVSKRKDNEEAARIKPFQECNRYLETQRYNKQPLKYTQRSLSRNAGTKLKTEYVELSCQKYKKEVSTKQTNTSSNQFILVSVSELKSSVQEYAKMERQVQRMEKELKFYKVHFHQQIHNSVVSALKI